MHGIEYGKYYLSHLDLNRDIDIIRRGYKRNGLRYLLDFGGVYLLYQLFLVEQNHYVRRGLKHEYMTERQFIEKIAILLVTSSKYECPVHFAEIGGY